MNVMNIKHLFSAAAALSLLAACSDYDPGLSEEVVDLTDEELATINEYTANFVARYGEIDPNHTWGFGELGEEQSTRASDPNSNMWVKVETGKVPKRDENGNIIYKDEVNPELEYDGNNVAIDIVINTDASHGMTEIPGFPVSNYYLNASVHHVDGYSGTNLNGYYHVAFPNVYENGNLKEFWFASKDELLEYMRQNRYTEVIPLGDVARCNTLDDAEVADVYAEFSKKWTGTNPAMNLKTYFVQQVWRGTAAYTGTPQGGGSPQTFIGAQQMDYLGASDDNTDLDHFYNYNNANFSNGQSGMMLIYNSTTDGFFFHGTLDANYYFENYRLVELHGNYYVGFDFESNGADEKALGRDYKYNDWIVKIIPGEGTIELPNDEYETTTSETRKEEERTYTYSRRVMCEDLGTTNDFDFDDVVFDVTYSQKQTRTAYYTTTTVKKNGSVVSTTTVLNTSKTTDWAPKNGDKTWTGQITLLASGGTLPIYVKNFDGTTYECHETLLGADASNLKVGNLYNPINVGHNVNNVDPKVLPAISGLSSTNPDDIDVLVYSSKGERATTTTTYVLPKSVGGQYEKEVDGGNKAPQKICVPVGTRWMREGQQIETVYTYFRNWVGSQNSEYNFGGSMDWTTQGLTNTGKLY